MAGVKLAAEMTLAPDDGVGNDGAVTLPKHLPALDGLRGVAIIMVLLIHCGNGWHDALTVLQFECCIPRGLTLSPWLIRFLDGGASGVTLFFVVSDFTLTLRSAADQRDLPGYAIRRLARVGPGFWLAAAFYGIMTTSGPRLFAPDGLTFGDAVVGMLFGAAWVGGASLSVVPGGWSVSVEVAFYIALPILIRAINGRILRALVIALAATALTQFRGMRVADSGDWSFEFYVNPIQQAPVFMFGLTAALIVVRVDMPRLSHLGLTALGLGIFWLPISNSGILSLVQPMPFAILAALAVALLAASPSRSLSNRFLCRLGTLSYSIYLVHFAVLEASLRLAVWLAPSADWRTLVLHVGFTLAASFAIASLTWRYVEQPAIRWAGRQRRNKLIEAASG